MKIFFKIFFSILGLSLILFFVLYTILIRYQISYAEQKVIEQNQILGSFLSEEIRVGYLQSQWPYESLSELTKKQDFLFWWVVNNDGTIYRSNDTSFMGTRALDYFPQMTETIASESVYSNTNENYAIYFKPFKIGGENWGFWLGFTTTEFDAIRKTIFLYSIVPFSIAVAIFGISLYLMVLFFTKPINNLLEGTMAVAQGNMDYTISIKARDEIGNLGVAFNSMTQELKKSRKRVEDYSKELEQKVEERTEELKMANISLKEKMKEVEVVNKLMVGRELKMMELKKKIDKLTKSKI
jgi:methyl-accepting chemotaxis protein